MGTQHLLQPLEVTHVKHAVVEEARGHEMRQACPVETGQVRGTKGAEPLCRSIPTPTSKDTQCQVPPQPILLPFILKGFMGDHELSTEF